MNYLRFIFKDWLGTFFLPALILIPMGWFLVPWAMRKRYEAKPKPSHPIHQKHWRYIRMPDWAWIWETNSGLMGDGTYIDNYIWHPGTWLGQYYWTAWRNPIRGWKYRIAGIDLDGKQRIDYKGSYEVDDVSGKFGWQFVITEAGGRTVTGLYGVVKLTNKYCFRLRMGYKVKPKYKNTTRRVGGTPLSVSIKKFNSMPAK